MPAVTSHARLADLMNSRLAGQANIEQGLGVDQMNRQQQLMGALGGIYQNQANNYGNLMNNAMQGAQLNLSAQQTHVGNQMNQRNQLMSMLQGYAS